MEVLRLDVAPLGHVERTPQGGLRIRAQPLSRTGIQEYKDPETGAIRREWRPPDEVGRLDSVRALAGSTLTNGHSTARVTTANWRAHAVGHIGDTVSMREDGVVIGDLIIQDETAIQDALAGRRKAVSVGYKVRLDIAEGVTPEGERYDAIQRDIRPNHVALVARGRAGAIVQLRLDADDLQDDEDARDTLDESQTSKTEANQVDKDKQIAELTAALTVANGTVAKLTGERDAAVTRADEAEKGAKALKATIPALVKARVELQDVARKRGVEVRADMSDADIKRAVIAKALPSQQVRADAGDEYLEGLYTGAIATPVASSDPRTNLDAQDETETERADDDDPPWVVAARKQNADFRSGAAYGGADRDGDDE